jgi:hypothetical protein
MVTGDHPGTAGAIAGEVGLFQPGQNGAERVLTGRDLRRTGFPPDPATVPVYARVDPEQKLTLVETLRASGHVVSVTGTASTTRRRCGAPTSGSPWARGSDVAREAADMVITDDNLATIVTAVREGRGIYDRSARWSTTWWPGTFRRSWWSWPACWPSRRWGIPLLPLQLLWINLLTDGLPAIALGVDPVDPSLMARPPRSPRSRLLSARRPRILVGRAVLMPPPSAPRRSAATCSPSRGSRPDVMFSVLVGAHLVYAFVARRPDRSPRRRRGTGRTSNRWLIAAVGAGMALQAVLLLWSSRQRRSLLLARRLLRGGSGP